MKPVDNRQMKKIDQEIIKVIKYFSIFAYYPTLKEIHTFLQAEISENSLEKSLDKLIGKREVATSKDTPPQYSIRKKISNNKYQISKKKLGGWRYLTFIKIASLFPQIRLIGLSGSISMMNAKEDDDIDLFIITAKNRLFTGRLITMLMAQLLGLRRRREDADSSSKVCLNLFFDERELKIPKFKQTVFVGHEVLQMKPIIVKGDIYDSFLKANRWVQNIFPNSSWVISKVKNQKSKIKVKIQKYLINFLIFNLISNFSLSTFNLLEIILKKLQLTIINRHRTTEIITSSQLWFHPDDFEKKVIA